MDGEPLVMLPGMMCDHRLFAPQIAVLQVSRDVIVPALYGASTIAGLAHVVLDGLPKRFALAGLSMGGIVAMEIMRQDPDRVTRLALMDTGPFAESLKHQVVRDGQISKVKSGGLRDVMRDDMKPRYLGSTSNCGAILELCMAMALDLGDDVFIQQSRALASRPDQAATLAKIKVPTLILHGAEDTLCPAKLHHAMHVLIPGSELVTIDCAGHLPCLENPIETTTALQHWLET